MRLSLLTTPLLLSLLAACSEGGGEAAGKTATQGQKKAAPPGLVQVVDLAPGWEQKLIPKMDFCSFSSVSVGVLRGLDTGRVHPLRVQGFPMKHSATE